MQDSRSKPAGMESIPVFKWDPEEARTYKVLPKHGLALYYETISLTKTRAGYLAEADVRHTQQVMVRPPKTKPIQNKTIALVLASTVIAMMADILFMSVTGALIVLFSVGAVVAICCKAFPVYFEKYFLLSNDGDLYCNKPSTIYDHWRMKIDIGRGRVPKSFEPTEEKADKDYLAFLASVLDPKLLLLIDWDARK